jgi:hypothetical protein
MKKSGKMCGIFAMIGMLFVIGFAPMIATAATAADNVYVDGNWFAIAQAKGESYETGSPTEVALQAQLKNYQDAADNKDLKAEEHFAIRSWVKGWVAAEEGLEAMQAGNNDEAREDLNRAVKYGQKAETPGAGLGEDPSRGDDSSAAFEGKSEIEGARVVAYAEKYLAKLPSTATAQ